MPVVGRPRPAPPPPVVHQPAPTKELVNPEGVAPDRSQITGEHAAVETGEIRDPSTAKASKEEYKPFFTQIGPAVTNRQHNRVVMVVPLLLIVSVLLFLFAYIASK